MKKTTENTKQTKITKQTKKSKFFVCLVIFVCFVFSLSHSDEAQPQKPLTSYGEPSQIGTITSSTLSEISGITPSRTAKGLWWVHNDSGDKARIYAINSSGKLLGRYDVTGARNRDWEDMAGFVDIQKKPILYLADFGDNDSKRDDLTIYRVREPDLSKGLPKGLPKGPIEGVTEQAEAFPFRYPDGRHDAEALFVDPKSGRPYVITKTMSPPCGVYRFPLPLRPGEKVTLEKVKGEAADRLSKVILITGAASSADGTRVVVRTYFGAFELTRTRGGPGSSFETIFSTIPVTIKLPLERQGEAISYTLDGKSIITTSERIPAPIFKINRY